MAKGTKRKKSDRLPKYPPNVRSLLMDLLLESDEYKANIEKGLPFFNSDQLSELERKYPNGMSWNEIDAELSKIGMIFKKPTFRKYLQEKIIPQAKGYRSTNKGREAIYTTDIIQHINFIQYYVRVADFELIDRLAEIFSKLTITVKEAIEGQLEFGSLRNGVYTYIRDMSSEGDDIQQAINDVLSDEPELRETVEASLNELYSAFNSKFEEFVNLLESHKIPVANIK